MLISEVSDKDLKKLIFRHVQKRFPVVYEGVWNHIYHFRLKGEYFYTNHMIVEAFIYRYFNKRLALSVYPIYAIVPDHIILDRD